MNSKKLSNIESKQRLSLSSLSNRSTDSVRSQTLRQFCGQSMDRIQSLSCHSDEEEADGDDDEEEESQSADKVRTMFLSLWNNVKFGIT